MYLNVSGDNSQEVSINDLQRRTGNIDAVEDTVQYLKHGRLHVQWAFVQYLQCQTTSKYSSIDGLMDRSLGRPVSLSV